MSRFFLILITSAVLLLSPSVYADGTAEQKSEISRLYKEYKDQLKAGKKEEALKLAEQMYALTPEVYGKISKSHATITFNLAQMQRLLRHYRQAATHFQEHVDILDELKVPKDEKYLGKLNFLAKAYGGVIEIDKAVKYGKKALRLAKKLKLTDEKLALYELNLGSYYYHSYGKGGLARRHINKAYDLYLSVYGDNHITTGDALFWQAKINTGFKKYSRAAERYEKVLEIYTRELPQGHDKILQVHAFLVAIYENLGEKENATKHCIAVATERPEDFDREINPLYKIAPTYPMSALRSRREGYIIAEFTVDELGQVIDIKTLEGKNVRVFEKNAHEAVAKFRYAPSIRDGKRIKTIGVKNKITFIMAD